MAGGASYNGYSWKERMAILTAYKRGDAGPEFTFAGKPCGLCGDPDRPANEWHSEDYSAPFSFEPPQTYAICKPCHLRLHKRFNRPAAEWELFCLHIEAGGYGREFASLHSVRQRETMIDRIATGGSVSFPAIRPMVYNCDWVRSLTLDPDSLEAPWARPRPFRPRPESAAYLSAFAAVNVSEQERALLRYHADAYRRVATVRDLAANVMGSSSPQAANLAYGRLAKRLCEYLSWDAEKRKDRSSIWLSVLAEGWYPPARDGRSTEYEWVMIPAVAEAVCTL